MENGKIGLLTEAEQFRRRWRAAFPVFVVVSLATAVVVLSLGAKEPLSAIYFVALVVGGLAGSITYYSVEYAYERKTKQRSITWLPLGMVVAGLLGFLWWVFDAMKF
jgi:hypothetical protein